VILRQLDAALEGMSGSGAGFQVAYEPVWAIGTGETATPADAEAAHGALRARLEERLGPAASSVPILYGGSVKPENAAELMTADDVDGVLVGGASLDPAGFAAIVDAAPSR
jgi:triosephosphate isomerase